MPQRRAIAAGGCSRLGVHLMVRPAWASSAMVWCSGRVHSGGRERLASVAELECTLWCAQLGLAQPWFGVAAECHSGGRERLAAVAELECTLGCAQLGLAQPWFGVAAECTAAAESGWRLWPRRATAGGTEKAETCPHRSRQRRTTSVLSTSGYMHLGSMSGDFQLHALGLYVGRLHDEVGVVPWTS